jgi:hypothetical protein
MEREWQSIICIVLFRLTNETKQTKNTAKDFDDENLDKQLWISGIGNGCVCSCDPDCHTATKITQADCKSTPEEDVACKKWSRQVRLSVRFKEDALDIPV